MTVTISIIPIQMPFLLCMTIGNIKTNNHLRLKTIKFPNIDPLPFSFITPKEKKKRKMFVNICIHRRKEREKYTLLAFFFITILITSIVTKKLCQNWARTLERHFVTFRSQTL